MSWKRIICLHIHSRANIFLLLLVSFISLGRWEIVVTKPMTYFPLTNMFIELFTTDKWRIVMLKKQKTKKKQIFFLCNILKFIVFYVHNKNFSTIICGLKTIFQKVFFFLIYYYSIRLVSFFFFATYISNRRWQSVNFRLRRTICSRLCMLHVTHYDIWNLWPYVIVENTY